LEGHAPLVVRREGGHKRGRGGEGGEQKQHEEPKKMNRKLTTGLMSVIAILQQYSDEALGPIG
jgi:hypothetical protein